MIQERMSGVPVGDLKALPEVAGLPDGRKREFDLLLFCYLGLMGKLQGLDQRQRLLFQLEQLPVLETEERLLEAEGAYNQAVVQASQNVDFKAVSARVRHKMATQKIPLVLKLVGPLVRLVLGGGPTKENVYLASFVQRRDQIQEELGEQVKNLDSIKRGRQDNGMADDVYEAEKALARFVCRNMKPEKDNFYLLISILPNQLELVARQYAELNASLAWELEYFEEFLKKVYKWDQKGSKHRENWMGKKRMWVVEDRPPTNKEYEELDREVKEQWKSFVERKFLTEREPVQK